MRTRKVEGGLEKRKGFDVGIVFMFSVAFWVGEAPRAMEMQCDFVFVCVSILGPAPIFLYLCFLSFS